MPGYNAVAVALLRCSLPGTPIPPAEKHAIADRAPYRQCSRIGLTFVAAVTLVQPAAQWALHWSTDRPGLVHLLIPQRAELVASFRLWTWPYYWHCQPSRVVFGFKRLPSTLTQSWTP
jgi:hypothetical protein